MFVRDPANPLLSPDASHPWEAQAAFNPGVLRHGGRWHMVYRAQAQPVLRDGQPFALSTIGHATSADGVHFGERRPLIVPEHDWERFGCEDPRIATVGDRVLVFYTALSRFPFEAEGIRVAVALTRDFRQVEKHLVTPFNAKAMALFPGRVGGRLAALLTVHTDRPPAKIALARFDTLDQLWSPEYWQAWYRRLDEHVVPLMRDADDQVEVGAPPLATAAGWLLLYARITGYHGPVRRFGVEAALLDRRDPRQVRARIARPLLQPERDCELHGQVDDVVFPSGAVAAGDELRLYYGAADTHACLARASLGELLAGLRPPPAGRFEPGRGAEPGFERFSGNPILVPRPEFAWERKACFNPAALRLEGRVHLLYRAMAMDGTSCFGYAASRDGVHIDRRLPGPVYSPGEPFELRTRPGNAGCEDPRLTLIDDTVYLFYTAFDGVTPRVAFSRIAVDDFLRGRWRWHAPVLASPPGVADKDACLLPRRIGGRYMVFHRAGDAIRLHGVDTLDFGEGRWLDPACATVAPRAGRPASRRVGIAAPPIETPHGWLLLYHRVTDPGPVYTVEAMLLAADDPAQVLADTDGSLLAPEAPCERVGQTPDVVFPCGAVVVDQQVYLYYGAADAVCCVARMPLAALYRRLGV